jgi:hypothetical protein
MDVAFTDQKSSCYLAHSWILGLVPLLLPNGGKNETIQIEYDLPFIVSIYARFILDNNCLSVWHSN